MSPRYLICQGGTLEGPQPKRVYNIIEPAKDHIKSLVLMRTGRMGDREVKAWLQEDSDDERGMKDLKYKICCGEG